MPNTKIIDIRGRKLGAEIPLICSPLVGRTRERLLVEAANVVAKKPDVIEWRVDYFDTIADTAAVVDDGARDARHGRRHADHLHAPLDQRGRRDDRDRRRGGRPPVRCRRREWFRRLHRLRDGQRAAHIREVRDSTRAHGTRLILSYHNFGYTPGAEFLVQRFLEAERLGADVAKVAVMPRDRGDVLTLLAATARPMPRRASRSSACRWDRSAP